MSIPAIRYDIPGSVVRYGVSSVFEDYAVRRHLVRGVSTQNDAKDELHTAQDADQPSGWEYHHVITDLPLLHEDVKRFGRNSWVVEQTFARRQSSSGGWSSGGIRQEIRIGDSPVAAFIRADAPKVNGLPYVDFPENSDWFQVQLDESGDQSPTLPPIHHMYPRKSMRIADIRTYDSFPVTGLQFNALNKVNSDAAVLNTIGITYQPGTLLFIGADFEMQLNTQTGVGKWTGAYYFEAISSGHYMQRVYWDDGQAKWNAVNDLQFESTAFAPIF